MPGKRPNIVIFAIDSIRRDHMSCYGYERLTTPYIDRLAAGGTLFENAFSAYIPTTPAYSSILTGCDVVRTQQPSLRPKGPLPEELPTLPEILRSAGYKSACVGFGGDFYRGFDKYLNFEGWISWEERPARKAENLNAVTIPELERLARSSKPFLLFLRHMDPHAPYLPPAPYDTMFYSKNPCAKGNKSMKPVFAFKPFADFLRSWMPPGVTDKDYVIAQYDGEIAYMDACIQRLLTRLEEPKHAGLTLLQKLKLYDGKTLPGFTEDSVRELRDEAKHEGMEGISPRYIQDKLSNALVGDAIAGCLNPFIVLRELETGLRHHSLVTSEEQRARFRELLAVVREEYDEIVKTEVQRAITADEAAISRLAANYIDNVKAYTQRERVRNRYTGEDEEPDERLMRSIEEKIDIPESRKDDFRREIMNYIAALALDGRAFRWDSNERLRKALELKLFEDQKDSIKLTSLVSSVVDQDTQEKIDIVKTRLINSYGYCDICATDVLNYVASIFARGDTKGRP